MQIRRTSQIFPIAYTRVPTQQAEVESPRGVAWPKVRCTTLDDIGVLMQTLEPTFDHHLDRFCTLNSESVMLDECVQLALLIDTHHEAFESALWWSLSRLVFSRFCPRDVFPGRLCKRLIDDAIAKPSCATMVHLCDSVRRAHGPQWDLTVNALTQLAEQTRRWTVWPDLSTCARAATLLDALEPAWQQAVAQLRASSRALGRNDAFRRARQWPLLISKILRTLASPHGGLRLLVEYLDSVCTHFRQSPFRHEAEWRGLYELFVLEVVGFVSELWCREPSDGLSPPAGVEQQGSNRRKRIQRARLRLFCHWKPHSNPIWAEQVLPMLMALAESG
jgi:hypothetical protein